MVPSGSAATVLIAAICLATASTLPTVDGFSFSHVATSATRTRRRASTTATIPGASHIAALAAAKKGFGNITPQSSPASTTPKKSKPNPVASPPSSSSPVPIVNEDGELVDPLVRSASESVSNPFAATPTGGGGGAGAGGPVSTPQGKAALDRLRRGRAEQRDEELRRLREVRMADRLVRESPEAAVIPERVAQRMGRRMLPFVGVPLLGGMASFVGFWYMATYRDVEFQPALVAATTIGLLAVGLVVRV
jgi:hypothetical protein